MEFENYIYFVLERNSNAAYTFTGYDDKATGETKYIYKGRKDRKFGTDLPHRFKFDKAHRSIRVHKDEKDIYGNSVVEHLRNYPECKDSPNGHYIDDGKGGKIQTSVWFREIKVKEDAVNAIEAKAFKLKAENIALALEGSELREMAVLCNCFSDDEGIQKHKVMEFAGAEPSNFMKFYEAPERRAKALLSKAVRAGEVSVRGTIYAWGDKTIGVTEDLAVSKLLSDEELLEALEENLKAKGVA